MSIALAGPFIDPLPPPEGKKSRWRFENGLGEYLHDLTITTHTTYWDDADIVRVTVKNKQGQVVADESFPGSIDRGVGSAHVTISPYIPPGEAFEVVVETDDDIGVEHPIIFTPSGTDEANVIAGVHAPYPFPSLLEFLWDAYLDATTFGGTLPIPITTPFTALSVLKLLRWLRGLFSRIPRLRGLLYRMERARVARSGHGMPVEGLGFRFAPGAHVTVAPDQTLEQIAWEVLFDRIQAEPTALETRRYAKLLRALNGISRPLEPGLRLVVL
jgi:hypothetical protein